jgi:hypothetical protein
MALVVDSIAAARAVHRRYAITADEYNTILAEQGGRCAICHATHPGVGLTHFAVDHDHAEEDRNVRGLLCSRCNQAIGLLGDSPTILLNAARYLNPVYLTCEACGHRA